MNPLSGIIGGVRSRLESRLVLTVLVALHSAVTCLSLIKVATVQPYIHFSGERVWIAVAVSLAFSVVSLLFVFARFSFGYFVFGGALAAALPDARAVHQGAVQAIRRPVERKFRTPAHADPGAVGRNHRRRLDLQFQAGRDRTHL